MSEISITGSARRSRGSAARRAAAPLSPTLEAQALSALSATMPPHLQPIASTGRHVYGRVRYLAARRRFVVEAEPVVIEYARRLFPGRIVPWRLRSEESELAGAAYDAAAFSTDVIELAASPRMIADLNWLMLRFPMHIDDPAAYESYRQQALEQAARLHQQQTLAPVLLPPDRLRHPLWEDQKTGASFLLLNHKALLADPVAKGKTMTALGAAAGGNVFPLLVVVEPQIQTQWQQQVESWLAFEPSEFGEAPVIEAKRGQDPTRVFSPRWSVRLHGRTPYEIPRVPVVVIHYGLLAAWRDTLLAYGFRGMVFDEVQALRHRDTAKYAAALALSEEMSHVWGLSATPIHGYGEEIHAVISGIEPDALGTASAFSRDWCVGYGAKTVKNPKALGSYLRREGLMLRREDDSSMPPVRQVTVTLDQDEQLYNKLMSEAVSLAVKLELSTDELEKGRLRGQIDRESRRASGVAKAPAAAAFVRGLVESGERVVLYAWHHDVHDLLMEKLRDVGCVRCTGRESEAQKQYALEQFKSGKANVLIMGLRNTAGIDGLQGHATCVVFAELDWAPAVHAQCIGRVRRPGMDMTLEHLLAYFLVSNCPVDEEQMEALGLKTAQSTDLLQLPMVTDLETSLAAAAAERQMSKVIAALQRVARERGLLPPLSEPPSMLTGPTRRTRAAGGKKVVPSGGVSADAPARAKGRASSRGLALVRAADETPSFDVVA